MLAQCCRSEVPQGSCLALRGRKGETTTVDRGSRPLRFGDQWTNGRYDVEVTHPDAWHDEYWHDEYVDAGRRAGCQCRFRFISVS